MNAPEKLAQPGAAKIVDECDIVRVTDADDCSCATEDTEEPWVDTVWRRSWLPYSDKFQNDYELELQERRQPVRVKQSAVAGKGKRQRRVDQQSDPALTGSTVWDAAIVCARYLAFPGSWGALCAQLGKSNDESVSVWELGSGTGLLGLSVASLGVAAKVVLTDLEGVLDLLRANVECNSGKSGALHGIRTKVSVRELSWGSEESVAAAMRDLGGPPDIVLGSDLVYRMPNVEPLLATLCLAVPPGGLVVLAVDRQHCPEAVARFREEAASTFSVEEVPYEQLDPRFRCRDVLVLRLQRTQLVGGDPSAAELLMVASQFKP